MSLAKQVLSGKSDAYAFMFFDRNIPSYDVTLNRDEEGVLLNKTFQISETLEIILTYIRDEQGLLEKKVLSGNGLPAGIKNVATAIRNPDDSLLKWEFSYET